MFGAYLLDPVKQNKLYVPHGFLHAFAVPKYSTDEAAVFMYYCDETYCKESEIHVNPMTILPRAVESLKSSPEHEPLVKMLDNKENLVLSDKDLSGDDYETKMGQFLAEYTKTKRLWYRD